MQSWARGKALGGSSAINFGMYSQASRKDLDNWAALGNDQWTFDSLSPYYRKSETFHKLPEGMEKRYAAEYLDPELRGTDGPIQVSLGENEISWVAELWPETVKNAGYPAPKDPRTGSAVGGFNQLMTSDPATATRSYSANAYWLPNKDRKNLDVLTDAFVTELTWDEAAESQGEPRVSGAAFEVDGKKYTVKAKKEVIVSCGTIQSPQLLEVSGIGSRGVLQPLGIDVKVENPNIGENLQDHLMVTLGFVSALSDGFISKSIILTKSVFSMLQTVSTLPKSSGTLRLHKLPSSNTSLRRADHSQHSRQQHRLFRYQH